MTKLPCVVCGMICAVLAFTTSRHQCRLLCNEPRVFAMASCPEYGAVLHRVGRTNSARFVRVCNSTLGRVGWMPPPSTAVGMCIEVARTRTGQRQLVVVIVTNGYPLLCHSYRLVLPCDRVRRCASCHPTDSFGQGGCAWAWNDVVGSVGKGMGIAFCRCT